MNPVKVVKINYLQNKYWYVPSILTTSKRKWLPRPYNNFKKLLVSENLEQENFIISLNRDKDLQLFRIIQAWQKRKIFLKKSDIEKINNDSFIEEKINQSNIYLHYDKKSIEALKKGFIPYFSDHYLRKNQHFLDKKLPKYILVWRKNGWQEKKEKKISSAPFLQIFQRKHSFN